MKLTDTIEFHIKATSLALSRMYNDLAQKYGITQTMGYVLMYVEKDGTPSIKLAWSLGMKDSSLTRLLKNMERKGLIIRKKDKRDKRISRVFLTEAGVEKRRIIKKFVLDFNKKIVEKLGEEKLKIFHEAFDIINKELNAQTAYKIN